MLSLCPRLRDCDRIPGQSGPRVGWCALQVSPGLAWDRGPGSGSLEEPGVFYLERYEVIRE